MAHIVAENSPMAYCTVCDLSGAQLQRYLNAELTTSVLGAEYKIDYLVSPGLAKQVYDVSLYFFFSSDLDAAEVSFFRSLYGVVRLHTPKVNCQDNVLVCDALIFAYQALKVTAYCRRMSGT
jgi:hypothetical protein